MKPALLRAFLGLVALLGCDLRVNLLKPVDPSLLDRMPSPRDFWDSMAFLLEHAHISTQAEPCLAALVGGGSKGCACGTSSFRVCAPRPDGRMPVTPCVYLHELATGDLLTQELPEILAQGSFKAMRRRRGSRIEACRDCMEWDACRGGCGARAWLTRGSLQARDPYCPWEAFDRGPDGIARWEGRPSSFAIRPAGGLRVHDDYLCTLIGRAPSPDPAFPTLDAFRES